MSGYTPEALNAEAVAVERMHGETLTVEWREKMAGKLRAFASTLEKLEEHERYYELMRDADRGSFVQAMENGAAANSERARADALEEALRKIIVAVRGKVNASRLADEINRAILLLRKKNG